MSHTIDITMTTGSEAIQEILIAEMSAIGYHAFEQKENRLHAFIQQEMLDEKLLQQILSLYQVAYKKNSIEEQNWNALWESNFEPVLVDDFCLIRAAFHTPHQGVAHEIIITPKMSFGTGHHATTYMMVSQMRYLEFAGKSVADFGTGTGILAIMAEKLGAQYVWAIDNDTWCIENATENIAVNHCSHIVLEKTGVFSSGQTFDIILANINRNVILDNIDNMVESMKKGTQLLLSGLLYTDEADVINAFDKHNIIKQKTLHRDNWISILMKYEHDL